MSGAPDLTVLSLGAGVQSSALLLMMVAGDLPQADVAIFADTQAEPAYVYEWLDYLTLQAATIGLPIERVSAGSLADEFTALANNPSTPSRLSIPAFVDGADGRAAPLRRECTRTFKIEPQTRRIRELLGGTVRGRHVHQLFGISLDEVHRMRTSSRRYLENHYPLIDARLTRGDCEHWLVKHGYPIPEKSACVFCPYHSNEAWQRMKADHPHEFANAVRYDRMLRVGTVRGLRSAPYLHRSRQPLDNVTFTAAQPDADMPDPGFAEECSGLCGT
jgi:hypothetical protein